ncbi:MAG: DUF5674 family protein [Patescibacteria group bacterium]
MIIKNKITKELLEEPFIKAVADIKQGFISLGCELHIDCAEELIKNGSLAKDLWGFNIYPDGNLDFVSLINIRPQDNNRSMRIQDENIKKKITEVFNKY